MKTIAAVLLVSAFAFALSENVDWDNVKFVEVLPVGLEKIVSYKSITERIVGGKEARTGQFPYQAGLLLDGRSWCGGSLIGKRLVLTAAHCVDGISEAEVYLGAHSIKDNEGSKQTIHVKKTDFIIHSGWNARTLINDIALIKLTEDARMGADIAMIELPSEADAKKTYVGDVAVASGWGRSSDSSNSVSEVLRYADLKVISEADCKRTFGTSVRDTNICTSGSDKSSTCNGDSGGPLVYGKAVIGLTSYGSAIGCEKGYPAVFTRVGLYLAWIKSHGF